MKKPLLIALVIALLLTLVPISAFAAGGTETANSHDDLVRLAADPAVHTIRIGQNITFPSGSDQQIVINRPITIEGNGKTITGNSHGRVFSITAATGEIVINNLTITESHNPSGSGGALNLVGTATLSGCTFTNNSVTSTESGHRYGGAVSHRPNSSKVLTLINCTFSGNLTVEGGGAVFSSHDARVIDCTFTGNQAGCGGALYIRANILLKNSVFDGNSATVTGSYLAKSSGAVATDSVGNSFMIDSCAFYNNTANDNGGAIHSYKDIIYSGDNYYQNNLPAESNGYGISFGAPGGKFHGASTGQWILGLKPPTPVSMTPIKGIESYPGECEVRELHDGYLSVFGSFGHDAELRVAYQYSAAIKNFRHIITGMNASVSGSARIDSVVLYVGVPFSGQIVNVYLDGEFITEALVCDGYISFKTDRLGAFLIGQ